MTNVQQLARSVPEAQGISSRAILAFIEAAERELQHLHSFMLLRHGVVVAEGWFAPYRAERRHALFSVSKSFTATAIGFAVAEGLLDLDDQVIAFFPDDLPEPVSEQLAAMRVRHLLSMSTGHTVDTLPMQLRREDGNWAAAFLACPVEFPPGTHFVYNTGASYMLSAILQQRAGMTLREFLEPRLFAPLGIVDAFWEQCPRGVIIGGYGLSTTTEAVARFGQLYLQGGQWQGQQLLPMGWVGEATRAHISNGTDPTSDWAQGYGFQFWRCRHGAYRGDGAFGQFCLVLPEQDAVLATTAGLDAMQPVLDLVWKYLLPAFGSEPLPANEAGHEALRQKLAGLALPVPVAGASSPAAPGSRQHFRCEPNELGLNAVRLAFHPEGCRIGFSDAHGEHVLEISEGRWHEGQISLLTRGSSQPVAAAGAWTSESSYLVRMRYIETPYGVELSFGFAGDRLVLDVAVNVSFDGATRYQVLGQAVPSATALL